MADWATELAGKILRLMGLLHVASHALARGPIPTTIDASVAAHAVRLGHYFTTHARAVFGLLGTDDAIEDAQFVLAKIRETRPVTIKRSDLYELAPGRFKKKDDVDATLALLVDRRVIRPAETLVQSARGRPPTTYEVNPFVYPANVEGNR